MAFKSVLAAQALQMVEHANRVKGRKWEVVGQALFPKSVRATPLQSQAFISFPSL